LKDKQKASSHRLGNYTLNYYKILKEKIHLSNIIKRNGSGERPSNKRNNGEDKFAVERVS